MHEILSIDDDPIHHEMIEAFFASNGGTRTVRALHGSDAKLLLADSADRFSLLICDLNMPDFDGVELLRYLRDIDCRAPILIVSGAQRAVVSAATELARAYELNLVGTLTKPLSFPALSSIIAPWLANRGDVASLAPAAKARAVAEATPPRAARRSL